MPPYLQFAVYAHTSVDRFRAHSHDTSHEIRIWVTNYVHEGISIYTYMLTHQWTDSEHIYTYEFIMAISPTMELIHKTHANTSTHTCIYVFKFVCFNIYLHICIYTNSNIYRPCIHDGHKFLHRTHPQHTRCVCFVSVWGLYIYIFHPGVYESRVCIHVYVYTFIYTHIHTYTCIRK